MNEAELAARERQVIDKEKGLAEAQTRSRVLKAASRLPFADVTDCYKLADLSRITEDPKSVEDEVRRVLNEHRYLAGPVKPPPSPGEPVSRRPLHRKPSSDEKFAQMLRDAPRRAGGKP